MVSAKCVFQSSRHATFSHHRVGFAEQGFADERDRNALGGGFDGGAQAGAASADHDDVVFVGTFGMNFDH
jgi:hypothetical protein